MFSDINFGSIIYQLVAFMIPMIVLFIIFYAIKSLRQIRINQREIEAELQKTNEKLDSLLSEKEKVHK